MEIARTKKWVYLKSTAILWTLCVSALLVPFCLLLISQPCKAQSSKQVDKIRIEKSKRTMSLLSGKEVLKTYKVALGSEPVGAKDRQGDHKTPEGILFCRPKTPK
jgi:murein L,D-transpeptidase YafK